MNKPLLGIVVGGILGALDGLTALVSAPEVAPQIAGIVAGSTLKGVLVGMFFAWLIARMPDPATGKHYYWEIMLPGSLAGAIVGFATQRFGRRPGAAAAALLLALVVGPVHAQTAGPDGKAAFDRLKTLVGDWEGHVTTPDGPKARVEFRLAGNGSALVERLFPGTDHEMVTVYHLSGRDLVLTHYCAMANQPRMKLVAGGQEGEIVFDFDGGDNVDPKTTTHMHGGRITLKDKDAYEADWQVVSQGKPAGNNRFFMERAR
jgi:hypothetical protein